MEEDRILQLLTSEDSISWRGIILNLVKSENMNPWDIDVSKITERYLETIKRLQELNFRVSGKVVLAAALLVRMKSSYLLGRDIVELDEIFASASSSEDESAVQDEFYEGLEGMYSGAGREESIPELPPRMPQPRQRKISMYELISALQKALEVRERRILRKIPPDIKVPEKKVDISVMIERVYSKIRDFLLGRNAKRVKFSEIVPSNKKQDKIDTFVPLLHLAYQQKVLLEQEKTFGEIEIMLYDAAARKIAEEQLQAVLSEQDSKNKPSARKGKRS
ncbi:MAG: ScpA family protein [Candidatus Woesearchaeota archaeon]